MEHRRCRRIRRPCKAVNENEACTLSREFAGVLDKRRSDGPNGHTPMSAWM